MKALIQRVKHCSVTVAGSQVSVIQSGMLILLGVKNGDNEEAAEYIAQRCADLRIFDDEQGKMNLSIKDAKGQAMVVSQFTLYGDTRKGNRPSYTDAAPPEIAERLYEYFIGELKKQIGDQNVKAGVFRTMMDVELINDGPVTVTVESKNAG